MDMFLEKIIKKRKSVIDILIITLIVILTIMASFFLTIFIPQFSLFLIVGIGYLAYILISKRNIEYEYAVTNGDLDIDMIINQKKRKRVFNANCKEFEVVAKVNSSHYTNEIKTCKNIKDYSSGNGNAEVWFISMRKDGQHTVILFEPLAQMIDNFAIFIPRKIFRN